MEALRGRTSLWEKEGGDEERVRGQLNDPHLAVAPDTASDHAAGLEEPAVLSVDAVVTVVGFNRLWGPVVRGRSCAGNNGDRLALPDEGARQACNDQAGTSWRLVFFVIGVPESKDVARELNDRVLESPSGTDQRHAPLPRVADRIQRTAHATIGTPRSNPEPVKAR